MNVWLPDELNDAVRAELPELNISNVLQEALRDRLGCRHDRAQCARCSAPLDPWSMANDRLDRFYLDLIDALGELMLRPSGTVEGACRVAKEIGVRAQIPAAARRPLPRPSRAMRTALKVRDLDPAHRDPVAPTTTEASA